MSARRSAPDERGGYWTEPQGSTSMAWLARSGDLYDQDGEIRRFDGQSHAGPGRLFDQEKSGGGRDGSAVVRRRRTPEPPRYAGTGGAAPPANHAVQARAPLVISSRPGARTAPSPPQARPSRNGPATTTTGRATAIVAAGTFASRLTGFARVLVIAYVLGVGSLSDAFNYANGIPNIIYDLLVGGVLSATLIPVFVEQFRSKDKEGTSRAISAVLTAVVAVLVVVSGLLWLLAPWVIRFYLLLSPASVGPAERALATRFLHFFAPQVFFLGAIVVSTALLNARRRFALAAFSPVLNNLVAIAALLVTKAVASAVLSSGSLSTSSALNRFNHDERAVWVLGIGTTLGYAVQFLVQMPATQRASGRLRVVWDLKHPAVRKVATLSSWIIGVVVANQLSLALVMVLAGRTKGGVTAYQYSYQFFQLPYALIVVSIATAIMPDLAERWSSGDRRGFENRFVSGFRITLAVLLPAALVYAVVARPFVDFAIDHGHVTGAGAHLVATTLACFAVGLPGFSAFFLLMRLYQAMQDTRTMFWLYVVENGLTVIAAPVLGLLFGVPGLALAWVVPYTIASVVAVVDLRRKVGPLGGAETVQALVRILVAAALTTVAVALVGLAFRGSHGDAVLFVRLVAQVAVAIGAYVLLARAMRIHELRPLVRVARRTLGLRT